MPFFGPNGGPLLNPYDLLNLEYGATDDEVAKSFKRLMLRLHPDKQPADQAAAEAAEISRQMHDVMDAKSFLLNGEHLAGRREYDGKLARAKQQATPSQCAGRAHGSRNGEASSGIPQRRRADPSASPGPAVAVSKKSAEATRKDKKSDKTDNAVQATSHGVKRNVNVKQWGARPRNHSITGRGGRDNAINHKTHPRAKFQGCHDSCGDCSTTEEAASAGDYDSKRRHTYSNDLSHSCATNNRPSSNRPAHRRDLTHKKKTAARSADNSVTTEVAERARLKAEEREQRLAAEAAGKARLKAAKERRLAAEAAEKSRIKAKEKERRFAAEAAKRARLEVGEKKRRLAAEAAEKDRLKAEQRERRLAVEAAKKARLEMEEKERRLAAEAAKRVRLKAEEQERRLAAKAAEMDRLEAEEKDRRLAAETAEKDRLKAEQKERRLASEAAKRARLEAEEKEKRLAAEAAERVRLKAEEQERRPAAEAAERDRLEAEEKDRRLAAKAAVRACLEAEEKERRLAAEAEAAEKARLEAREKEQRLASEAIVNACLEAEEKERRLSAEAEADERARLEAKEKERRLASEAAVNACLKAEEKERRLAAEAEAAERARLETREKERRLASEAAVKACLKAEEKERRLAAAAAKKARLKTMEQQRRLAEEKEQRLTAEAVERVGLEAEENERRLAVEASKRARLEEERSLAAETAERAHLESEEKERPFSVGAAEKAHLKVEENADNIINITGGKKSSGRLGGLFSSLTSARVRRRVSRAPPASPEGSEPLRDRRPTPEAITANFSRFNPAMDTLEKQYHCPLTQEMMKEPVSDAEGNCYERAAILKYLETRKTSPVTGNPLLAVHLTDNSALKEKIRYTLKLKDCINYLQHGTKLPPSSQLPPVKQSILCKAVDSFIKDLDSGSSAIAIAPLNSSGSTSFSYLGLKIRLEVPGGVSNTVIVQTWFKHSKKAAAAAVQVSRFNSSLQTLGLGGKLTFRTRNGKHTFALATKMNPDKSRNIELKHVIEHFVEMSVELNNIFNTTDTKRAK